MSMGSSPFQGGGGAASIADATETTAGKIRIATSAEAATGTNDLTAMTPLTVKERIDASLVGAVQYQGTFNATAGTPSLANAEQGDLYVIDTAGTIYGATWSIGDHLLINANMGGTIDSAKIDKVDNTNEDASETVKGVIQIATSAEATTGTNDLKAMTPLTVKERIDALNLGTASTQDVGTSASNVVQLDGSARLPAVDGSQLTNLPSASDASETVKGIIEIATNAEAQAASATDKALVPSNIGSIDVGSLNDDSTYQPLDAGLTSISGLTTSANKFIYTTASDTYAVASISAAGRSFVSANDAGAQRSALGLGTAATSASTDFLASTAAVGDLSDVSITSVSNGQVLSYNSTSGDWENSTPASGGLASVSADTDPTLGGDLKVGGFAITSTSNGDVTLDPNGTGDVVLGADLMPDADATHYIGDENTRFISAYTNINGAVQFKAKNDQGASISKGQAVYLKGVSGTVPTIGLARANSASTMPAFGLALTDANDQAEVQIVTFGNLSSYNTTTYSLSAGDTVFVSAATAGALTSSAPAGESNLIQNIGRVVRADASAGIIKVGGAGRSNATPNLDQNKIFLGNASNQAVSTALSAIDVSAFNDDGTYLKNLSEDTTPQLGGNLDLNGSDIVTTSNADLDLAPNGTGVVVIRGNTNSGALKLNCENNSHGVTIQGPPHSAAATYTLTLPNNDGDADQVLKTDGSGGLSWTTVSGGGSAPSVTSASPSANYAITTYTGLEEIYLLTPSADIDVTLPAASSAGSGYKFNIKNLSTNTITLKGATGDNIDGVAPASGVPISTQYESLTVVTDGSNWFII